MLIAPIRQKVNIDTGEGSPLSFVIEELRVSALLETLQNPPADNPEYILSLNGIEADGLSEEIRTALYNAIVKLSFGDGEDGEVQDDDDGDEVPQEIDADQRREDIFLTVMKLIQAGHSDVLNYPISAFRFAVRAYRIKENNDIAKSLISQHGAGDEVQNFINALGESDYRTATTPPTPTSDDPSEVIDPSTPLGISELIRKLRERQKKEQEE